MIAVNRLQQHRNADTRTCGNRFSSIVRGANASTRLLAGSMKTCSCAAPVAPTSDGLAGGCQCSTQIRSS
jgi:hypothetical protein